MDEAWENYKRGTKGLPRTVAKKSVAEKAAAKPAAKPKKKFVPLVLDETPSPAAPTARLIAAPQPVIDDPDLLSRLRSGEARCEAKLDLHHLTEAEAYNAVNEFLSWAFARRWRYLLVVTGRGAVLRAALPRWLGSGALAGKLRFIHEAAPKHGGAGAFYVVLRVKRSDRS